MSHPIPGHDYSEQTKDESKKEYSARKSAALKKVAVKMPKKEKLSSFAKSIGLAKGKHFCNRCESQTHSVDFEGKCKSCAN